MSAAFISLLPQAAKLWSAKAIAGIIVADGHVTEGELGVLRESISFLEDAQAVQDLVEMVKNKEKPELEALKCDRKLACKILISLAMVAMTDGSLTGHEINYFNYIGGKLGFERGYCALVIKWAKEFLELEKKKDNLVKLGEKQKPVYQNY